MVKLAFAIPLSLILASCGGGTSALQTRVDRLEREVAELKGAKQAEPQPAANEPYCKTFVDTSIPRDTQFPYVVDYQLGAGTTRSGDRIQIVEVRGTRPNFEEGGIYLVKGEYTLASVSDAKLLLSVTATQRGKGCTKGNSRGSVEIAQGSGTFELAAPIPYAGHPHVTFYDSSGSNAGGVYFGKGDFLKP
jgi:hypothetical protein